jgi:serine protease Do
MDMNTRMPLSSGDVLREIEGLATLVRTFTVAITGRHGESLGSGIIWHPDGVIATNAHVASRDRAVVRLPDGREMESRLIARDPRRDLALLSVPAQSLLGAPAGDATRLRAGSLVLGLGHPWGVPNALSLGVVHSIVRSRNGTPRWIAADLRLAPGNSGGPMVDASGCLVGVNAMIVNGLGAAIPVNVVQAFAREVGERGGMGGSRAWAA